MENTYQYQSHCNYTIMASPPIIIKDCVEITVYCDLQSYENINKNFPCEYTSTSDWELFVLEEEIEEGGIEIKYMFREFIVKETNQDLCINYLVENGFVSS